MKALSDPITISWIAISISFISLLITLLRYRQNNKYKKSDIYFEKLKIIKSKIYENRKQINRDNTLVRETLDDYAESFNEIEELFSEREKDSINSRRISLMFYEVEEMTKSPTRKVDINEIKNPKSFDGELRKYENFFLSHIESKLKKIRI